MSSLLPPPQKCLVYFVGSLRKTVSKRKKPLIPEAFDSISVESHQKGPNLKQEHWEVSSEKCYCGRCGFHMIPQDAMQHYVLLSHQKHNKSQTS